MAAAAGNSLKLQGSCSAEFPAGFDPKGPPDLQQGPGPPQAPEEEGLGEALAHPQGWVVVVEEVVVVVWVEPQLQGVEGVVAQSVLWLEGVVVEGPLGQEVGVPVELVVVAVAHLPKVQGAADQNDPCYSPQLGAGGAGSLLGMAVGVVEADPGASSPAAQLPARPGPQ